MKTYSVGRDINCDIVIDDSTDVISRRHALLNVTPSGKMTIVDQSNNGTYINGIRISSNAPVPVTRKDTISFAHVAKLDWNLVPRSNQWIKHSIIGASGFVVLIIIVIGLKQIGDNFNSGNSTSLTEISQDSINNTKSVAKQDSIKKAAKQDSIKKATIRNDSILKAKSNKKKVEKNRKPDSANKEDQKNKRPNQNQENKKPTRVAG